MKWITREKVKVDRVACPWLIKRFIYPEAEFVFLPKDTDWSKISDGILDSILVHPREVFKPAITANASAIVLVHNHPSGDPTPSEADIKVTRDLIRAGQLLKIDVLDHVILGKATADRQKDFLSLCELGYFYS